MLSGMHKGRIKHLLLVDPNGVVCSLDVYSFVNRK